MRTAAFPLLWRREGGKAQPWRAEAQAVLMAVVVSGTARGVWASLGVLRERQREGCRLPSTGWMMAPAQGKGKGGRERDG